jgi:hypothetical protein
LDFAISNRLVLRHALPYHRGMANQDFEFAVETRKTNAEAVKRRVGQYPGCRFEPTAVDARWMEGKVIVTSTDAQRAEAHADTIIKQCNLARSDRNPSVGKL